MGDTHEKMSDRKEMSRQLNRCYLVVEFMKKTVTTEQMGDIKRKWCWLHSLEPAKGDGDGAVGDWAGRMQEMRRMMSGANQEVIMHADSTADKRDKRLEQKLSDSDKRTEQVQQQLQLQDRKLEQAQQIINQRMDKRIDQLQEQVQQAQQQVDKRIDQMQQQVDKRMDQMQAQLQSVLEAVTQTAK